MLNNNPKIMYWSVFIDPAQLTFIVTSLKPKIDVRQRYVVK